VARGERFAFDAFSTMMRNFRDNLPEVVDGFDLYAGGEPFSGYSYIGAAYVLAPRDLDPLAEKLHGALSKTPRVLARPASPR
jgi:urease accessory protein